MNKNQWYKLSISSVILMFIFIGIDSLYRGCSRAVSNQLSVYDIWCIVNAEIYEPFIYLFFILNWIFLICGWLEKKNGY